jgi:thioredoxin 2
MAVSAFVKSVNPGATMTTTTTEKQSSTLMIQCQFCQTWNRIDATRAADRPKCGKCGRPILLDRPLKLTDDTFDRTIESAEVPVLVDFYADWCGPCKMMAPSIDQLAAKVTGRALVAKLDTDASPKTAQRFDIRGIPSVIVFRHGKAVTQQAGAVPLAALEKMLALG